MEQETKHRGRPKKEPAVEIEQVQEQADEQVQEVGQAEEISCGHNSLIEDGRGTYCALCGKRV